MILNNKEEKNPVLESTVDAENEIKNLLVQYAGNKIDPDIEGVTVGVIIEALSEDFPELILAIAEENFIRGYKQAFVDIEITSKNLMQLETDEQ